ncbi:MAG: HAMP domain-containing histidine kinase [Actinobacteria bacterium]|nr:HAMP domain-containing histidine kinase [Actinomycetota bacterium]
MRSAFRRIDPTLRTRLVLLLVLLAAVGLAALDVVSYRALDSYLTGRVDQQVTEAVGPVTFALARPLEPGELPGGHRLPPDGGDGSDGSNGGGGPDGGGPGLLVPPGTFGQLRTPSGRVLAQRSFVFFDGSEVARPDLSGGLAVAPSAQSAHPVTVGERGGGSETFRAVAVRGRGGLVTVAAVPLGEVQSTLDRLALIEIVVSAAILIALAILAWWLVRVGLQPLRRMEEAAGEIAAGDLSRRVEPANSKTEVGRLGLALNAMLGQIETAFAEREAGERRLRQFLADASHELRTPLASIRGYAELYRMGAQTEPAQVTRAMERIEAESTRMGGLVDDLLTLARIDEVREPVREPVALGPLLADAVDDARAAAPERRFELSEEEGIEVLGDADRLRRVFANLLRNAVVHTPEGTAVEVSLQREGGEAAARVRDHGTGLPGDDPEAVFERFWRSSASRGRDDGGSGLGLAIVAAVAAAHGGRAEAANAPGGGAVFTVRLPLA